MAAFDVTHQSLIASRNRKAIPTLTVNPALVVSTSTEQVFSGHKLRCSTSRVDPGGGGVNVARVVQRVERLEGELSGAAV